jgi:hypothetical protein
VVTGASDPADEGSVIRPHVVESSLRSPQWFDSAHQTDIAVAFDIHLAGGLHERGHAGPRPERVRELGQLAAASALPARAALLRWGGLPAVVRSRLLTSWYGRQQSSTAA